MNNELCAGILRLGEKKEKQMDAAETQHRPAFQWIGFIGNEAFVVHPCSVRAGKVNDLISGLCPPDPRMSSRHPHLKPINIREIKHWF